MRKIKTLVVDDEPYLLELTKIFLERHHDIQVTIASSGLEALNKIGREEFEVVVSDYQMPSMDGLQLLKALRDRKSDIPFILFTGKGRESVAVDALNLGASFYLQKGGDPDAQFTVLANMIRRSDESQRSRRQLVDSENRFRNLVQNSSDFITIINKNGIVVYSSSSIEKILGYDENFLLGKSPLHIIHPEDHKIALAELVLVNDNRHDGIPAEFRVRKKDGQYIPVEAIGKNMFGVANVDGMVITTRPIVERKKAEMVLRESEELYHTLFDKSPLSITLNDIEGRFVDVHPPGRNVRWLSQPGTLREPHAAKGIHNLIDNSVRHGGHVLTISLECKNDDGCLSLVYLDDGIGIPVEDKERIFLRGYVKNTGLGLFLIREILNMTGISIVENGVAGEGARFEIRVPLGGYRRLG
jgi:PAS domain S-box-containing protein